MKITKRNAEGLGILGVGVYSILSILLFFIKAVLEFKTGVDFIDLSSVVILFINMLCMIIVISFVKEA